MELNGYKKYEKLIRVQFLVSSPNAAPNFESHTLSSRFFDISRVFQNPPKSPDFWRNSPRNWR